MKPTLGTLDEVTVLARSWRGPLDARDLSPKTIRQYVDATTEFARFLEASGMPTAVGSISREQIEACPIAIRGRTTASTAATRYRGLLQFIRWLVVEVEIKASPMARMSPPKVGDRLVPIISDDVLRRLFKSVARAPILNHGGTRP